MARKGTPYHIPDRSGLPSLFEGAVKGLIQLKDKTSDKAYKMALLELKKQEAESLDDYRDAMVEQAQDQLGYTKEQAVKAEARWEKEMDVAQKNEMKQHAYRVMSLYQQGRQADATLALQERLPELRGKETRETIKLTAGLTETAAEKEFAREKPSRMITNLLKGAQIKKTLAGITQAAEEFELKKTIAGHEISNAALDRLYRSKRFNLDTEKFDQEKQWRYMDNLEHKIDRQYDRDTKIMVTQLRGMMEASAAGSGDAARDRQFGRLTNLAGDVAYGIANAETPEQHDFMSEFFESLYKPMKQAADYYDIQWTPPKSSWNKKFWGTDHSVFEQREPQPTTDKPITTKPVAGDVGSIAASAASLGITPPFNASEKAALKKKYGLDDTQVGIVESLLGTAQQSQSVPANIEDAMNELDAAIGQ